MRPKMPPHKAIAADIARNLIHRFNSPPDDGDDVSAQDKILFFEGKFLAQNHYPEIFELGYFLSLCVLVGRSCDQEIKVLEDATGTKFHIGPISPSLARYVCSLFDFTRVDIKRIFFPELSGQDHSVQKCIDQLRRLSSIGESKEWVGGSEITYSISTYTYPEKVCLYETVERRINFSLHLYKFLCLDQLTQKNHLVGRPIPRAISEAEKIFIDSLNRPDKLLLSHKILQTGNLPLFLSMGIDSVIEHLSLLVERSVSTCASVSLISSGCFTKYVRICKIFI